MRINGFSYYEISKKLGITENSARVIDFRTKKWLKDILEKEDLIPLVKDNAASDESVKLVSMHLESCERCRLEFNNYSIPSDQEVDDQKVLNISQEKTVCSDFRIDVSWITNI